MAARIGINGFGRIGRLVLRAGLNTPGLEFVAVNDLADAATLAHLFKYDSVHGALEVPVQVTGDSFEIGGRRIRALAEKDLTKIPWRDLGVDFVVEATGLFRSPDACAKHLAAGAKKVLITAPPKDPSIKSFVVGINHTTYNPATDHIISNASCTTNCVVPVAKVLHDRFRITHAYMTTVHAYTNDQRILDQVHKDLRRARAAALSMIPTSTGAAKLIGKIIPELAGKVDGMAIRVPTADVSLIDLACEVEKPATKETVNAAFQEAAAGPLKGVLEYRSEELVSIDFVGNPHSAIFDAPLTAVTDGTLVKLYAWYDNEWGYSNRVIDLLAYISRAA